MEQNNEQQGEGCAEQPTAAVLLRAEKKTTIASNRVRSKNRHTQWSGRQNTYVAAVLESWSGGLEQARALLTTKQQQKHG
jgi:hypothetical protein